MMQVKDFILRIARKAKRKLENKFNLFEDDLSINISDKEMPNSSLLTKNKNLSKEDLIDGETLDKTVSGEQVAKMFHEVYEELAPQFGYKTKEESAVSWENVPAKNKELMIATCEEILSKLFDEDFDVEEKYPEDKTLNLVPVSNFFESYVGAIVTGYEVFDNILDDFEDDISGKIISGVKVDGNFLYVKLNSINGIPSGSIKLIPARTGEFVERDREDEPVWASRYRIELYGGAVLEYLDSEGEGSAQFFDNQKEK